MSWLKLDGGHARHPKVRDAGLEGRALWYAVLDACAELNSDGLVTPRMAKDAAYVAEVDQGAAMAVLVSVGLLHDPVTVRRCARCLKAAGMLPAKRLQRGEWYVHDWLVYQPTKDEAKLPEVRWKKMRMDRLHRNQALKEQVYERDGDHCRYCAKRVDFTDRVSDDRGTYDHVDPNARTGPKHDGNTLENVVVACGGCNVAKGNRTPEEAGMTLLPPPNPGPAPE